MVKKCNSSDADASPPLASSSCRRSLSPRLERLSRKNTERMRAGESETEGKRGNRAKDGRRLDGREVSRHTREKKLERKGLDRRLLCKRAMRSTSLKTL